MCFQNEKMLSAEQLQAFEDQLTRGGLHEAISFHYPLFMTLLKKWLFTNTAQVNIIMLHRNFHCTSLFKSFPQIYLCSPKLDGRILREMVEIFLSNSGRPLGRFHSIFTNFERCDGELCAEQVKQQVMKRLSDAVRAYAEYHVVSKLTHPMRRVRATFLAVVLDGEAHVLVSSAALHSDDLCQSHVHSVVALKMSKEEFEGQYVQPLLQPEVV